jgi:hypothetical protein
MIVRAKPGSGRRSCANDGPRAFFLGPVLRPTWLAEDAMATSARKAVRPTVVAMQVKSMEVILRHAETTRVQPAQRGEPAPVVLRTKMRVASKESNSAGK